MDEKGIHYSIRLDTDRLMADANRSRKAFEALGKEAARQGQAIDDAFAGQAQSVRGGFAGVQVKGFLTLPITGSVALGRVSLAADGTGGVQAATTGGVTALVVSVDAAAKTAVVCL